MDFHYIVMFNISVAYILLINNQMIFLMQFETRKHFYIFQGLQIALVLWALCVYLYLFVPNCTQNHVLTCVNCLSRKNYLGGPHPMVQ